MCPQRSPRKPPTVLILVLAAIVCVAPSAVLTAFRASSNNAMGDFRAFYCASKIASARADPYEDGPLYRCESAPSGRGFYRTHDHLTIPAPLPPYALALVWPLTTLPFPVAALAWYIVLLIACAICVAVLSRLTSIPLLGIGSALGTSLAALSLWSGEVVPLCVAMVCVSAACLKAGRQTAAVAAMCVAMIEPHVALPAAAGVCLWSRKSATQMIAGFAILAAVSFAFGGWTSNFEYIFSVLPAHALSELARNSQYSFSRLAYFAHVPPAQAVRLGEVWYAAMILSGVALARALARRRRLPELAILIPPAFAVFGGTFIHITQAAAALPAALAMWSAFPNARRALLPAILALMIPWGALVPVLMPFTVFAAGALVWTLTGLSMLTLRWMLATSVAATIALLLYAGAPVHSAAVAADRPQLSFHLAEAAWAQYSWTRDSAGSIWLTLLKLPTWYGLAAVLVIAALLQRQTVRDQDILPLQRTASQLDDGLCLEA